MTAVPSRRAALSIRGCSAYLEVDTCAIAINKQLRFDYSRTLLIQIPKTVAFGEDDLITCT